MRHTPFALTLPVLLLLAACPGPDPTGEVDAGRPDAAADGGEDGGEPECTDACAAGSQSCDGSEAYRLCGQYDVDACLELSPAIACAAGWACSGDRCVPPCRDECPVGATLCTDETTVAVCGNFDADACRESGGAAACPATQRCEAGACVPEAAACTDECVAGQTTCFGDALRTCGAFDEDECLDLSPPDACGAGQVCREGACVPFCADGCGTEGETQCVGNAVRTCGHYDADHCLEWSAPSPCEGDSSCSNGACAGTCEDECSGAGTLACTADGSAVTLCGEYDGDACLDRASPIPCPLGYACQGGICVASCTNDCTPGQGARCTASGTGLETCGDFDDDPCFEWGGTVSCPGGASCSDGACEIPCEDACSPEGAAECTPGADSVRTCGQYDLDACIEWSSASACASWEVCESGACGLGETPAALVISELLYDAAGTDGAPGNNLFLELVGPGGTSLDGWSVVGVNGNGGVDYNAIALDGEILGADGYFVIAHPSGRAELLALADITTEKVDFQNGPDSVQLRWRGRVVDALGYGTFGASTVFAGEGSPAPASGQGASLSRDASHTDTDDNAADFSVQPAPTPRAGQSSCADECPALGETRCSGTDVQTCRHDVDADPCLEWAPAVACAGTGELCQGDACRVPCSDGCPQDGATECSGTQVRTCGDTNADGCVEWSAAADCPAGQVCTAATGACQDTTAPEVVLITPQGTIQTTQGAVHRVLVDATASPGRSISEVRFYADGVQFAATVTAPHEANFTVPAGAVTGSTLPLQARATDSAGVVGASALTWLAVRNDLPLASFTATITNVSTVTVDAGASSDTETPAAALEVCWDWDADGSCDTGWSTTRIATHDYGASGTYTVGLKVRDGVGQIAETTRQITFSTIQYLGGQPITTTVWYGTIVVTGDLDVPAGETLTIAAGTQVLFVNADVNGDGVGDYTLTVNGALVVDGTAASPVIFSSQDATKKFPGAWDRILLTGAASTIRHALVEYADVGFQVKNGSTFENVTVRSTQDDCFQLENADGATLTDVTVTACGGDGVDVYAGSTGVVITGLSSTSNGRRGLDVRAGSAVAASDSLLSTNVSDGARAGQGSTLDLSGSVLERNGGAGLSYFSTGRGTATRNQLRESGAEGLRLLGDGAGDPSPVANLNNVYSNATSGSSSLTEASLSLSASVTCCSSTGATSATYTAPAGKWIRAVQIAYTEGSDSASRVNGYLIDKGTGVVLRTFTASFTGWVHVPEGVTSVAVRVSDSGSSYDTDRIQATRAQLLALDGASDVVAISGSLTPNLRYNYLGTFPNVLSRVTLSRTDAADLQGFVGAPFDAAWDRGPYVAGPVTTTTWPSTVYVTGNVAVVSGERVTLAPGTQVLFVPHDQDGDGQGDFGITAAGGFDAAGAGANPVTFQAYGGAAGDAFQRIALEGTGADASVWTHTTVRHGRAALLVRASSLTNVSVVGGGGDGVTVTGAALLTDVQVSGAGGHGLRLTNADNAVLERVTTTGNLGAGLRIEAGSSPVTVSRLSSRGNSGDGVTVVSSTPALTDSTLRDNLGNGLTVRNSGGTYDYNLVTANAGAGLSIEGSGSPSARYNIAKYNQLAGVAVFTDAGGSPSPTVQYSNIYGNATLGNLLVTEVVTNATLTASTTCCSATGTTSAAYTAPAEHSIRRVWIDYTEGSDSSSRVNGYLLDGGSGTVLSTFTASRTGWVMVPEGTTSVKVRVVDTGSSYDTDRITGTRTELSSVSNIHHYELTSITDAGATNAQFNYWTANIGDVPSKIHQSRLNAVDYTGFTGAEYPSGTVTQVGPRP